MKKWIIIAALAVLLVVGILIAEKISAPDVTGGNRQTETTETEVTYSEADLKLMETTWEEYQAMTKDEQQNFKNSFSSLQVYIDWYWQAKEVYDAKQNVQVIGPGQSIDISELVGGTEDTTEGSAE